MEWTGWYAQNNKLRRKSKRLNKRTIKLTKQKISEQRYENESPKEMVHYLKEMLSTFGQTKSNSQNFCVNIFGEIQQKSPNEISHKLSSDGLDNNTKISSTSEQKSTYYRVFGTSV